MAAYAITANGTPNPASGNTTADGTEQTLWSTSAAAGAYMLQIDCINMADADVLELRFYAKVNGSATEHLVRLVTLVNTQSEPVVIFGPFFIPAFGHFSMKQTVGTNRAFQWAIGNHTE